MRRRASFVYCIRRGVATICDAYVVFNTPHQYIFHITSHLVDIAKEHSKENLHEKKMPRYDFVVNTDDTIAPMQRAMITKKFSIVIVRLKTALNIRRLGTVTLQELHKKLI